MGTALDCSLGLIPSQPYTMLVDAVLFPAGGNVRLSTTRYRNVTHIAIPIPTEDFQRLLCMDLPLLVAVVKPPFAALRRFISPCAVIQLSNG